MTQLLKNWAEMIFLSQNWVGNNISVPEQGRE